MLAETIVLKWGEPETPKKFKLGQKEINVEKPLDSCASFCERAGSPQKDCLALEIGRWEDDGGSIMGRRER